MPLAKVNGININYRTDGEGPPIVLISGLGAGLNAWTYQTGPFKKDHRVISFDNRGVGKSDKPQGPYTVKLMAEDTVGLMDHLGLKAANIVGVSMGGAIAMEIALTHPERVLKLVLGCSFACVDENNGGTAELRAAARWPLRRLWVRVVSLSLNSMSRRIQYLPMVQIQSVFWKKSDFAGLQGQVDAVADYNCLARLPAIIIPTLVIVGTKDRVVKPTSSETIARQIPNAKLVKIANGSHVICVESSKRFNEEILGFLKAN